MAVMLDPSSSLSAVPALAAIARVGMALVGAVFVYAGGVKALSPSNFRSHLEQLGWVPAALLDAVVIAVTVAEVGGGAALLVGLAPGATLLVGAVGVLLLAAASVWAVRSGRVTDCGCYGGYFTPSIAQSVTLNALYAAALVFAWRAGVGGAPPAAWKLALVGVVAALVGVLTAVAQRHEMRHGRPLVDLNPLKPDHPWRPRWAAGAVPADGREWLVAYLGLDCPFCHQWIRVLNAVHRSAALPDVVGVVGAPDDRRQAFVVEQGIRFPVVSIKRSRMDRLVSAVPTTLLVQAGTIRKKWSGGIDPEFLHRFNRAFFSDLGPVPSPPASGSQPAPT